MSADSHIRSRRSTEVAVLALILAVAAAARLWSLTAGVPHALAPGEPQVVDRALRILRTGDWNPHVFDEPALAVYFNAFVAIGRFLWGGLKGEWASLDAFTIGAVYTSGRLVAALIGVAAVWLTYRLGAELASRRMALLAAAQLAVAPVHVRESHFVLPDVPMAALTTLTVWLSVRAARLGTVRAYAWAGLACGFAAAARYSGAIAVVGVLTAWGVNERASPDRLRKLAAIVGGAAVAFLAGAPYTILDLPGFLDGLAAQFARAHPPGAYGPGWFPYRHVSPAGEPYFLLLAMAGVVVLLWRSATRTRWLPPILFTFVCLYLRSTQTDVSGRYALALLPMLCLFTSAAAVAALHAAARFPSMAPPMARRALGAAAVILLTFGPVSQTVRWLNGQKRSDTRTLAADWLKLNAPRGTRIAVENNGPTYLGSAGFQVSGTDVLPEKAIDWYRQRVDYLVISAADLARYGDYVNAGPSVFRVGPTAQRGGPPILIVKLVGG